MSQKISQFSSRSRAFVKGKETAATQAICWRKFTLVMFQQSVRNLSELFGLVQDCKRNCCTWVGNNKKYKQREDNLMITQS